MDQILDMFNARLLEWMEDGTLVLDHENQRVLCDGIDAAPLLNECIHSLRID